MRTRRGGPGSAARYDGAPGTFWGHAAGQSDDVNGSAMELRTPAIPRLPGWILVVRIPRDLK